MKKKYELFFRFQLTQSIRKNNKLICSYVVSYRPSKFNNTSKWLTGTVSRAGIGVKFAIILYRIQTMVNLIHKQCWESWSLDRVGERIHEWALMILYVCRRSMSGPVSICSIEDRGLWAVSEDLDPTAVLITQIHEQSREPGSTVSRTLMHKQYWVSMQCWGSGSANSVDAWTVLRTRIQYGVSDMDPWALLIIQYVGHIGFD
jgi:hypothetical protein